MSYRNDYIKVRGPIPEGWHIHHIIPRSEGGTDEVSNLIALHPNMHQLVHEMRGDKRSSSGVYNMRNGHTQETKDKISKANTGNKYNLGKTHSSEVRAKIGAAGIGREFSDETRALWSEQRSGENHWSYGTKKPEISTIMKQKKPCIHCGFEGNYATLGRWHNANCKFKETS